ncbi:Tetratricopeptide repeat containing protein, Hsp40 [Trachipleistophora hominis]|uniref:Tetratricopeptide repeat containing protein, Hsp40 n=1 Tax=Trachipleistophora hominis TaxID=72359 RepID=L7JSY4_TRAHO|nr:Tetratricopeptide repeat containing protein, Hsp40 [Trachipleistophora hominis]
MPNNKKLSTFILTTVTAVTAALFYYGYKKYRERKRLALGISIKEEGNAHYRNKEYAKALEKYNLALSYTRTCDEEHLNILNNIALTYILLRNYEEALIYTNRFLALDRKNARVVKRRYEIHVALEMPLESVRDAFIAGFLDDNQYGRLGRTALESVAGRETKSVMEKKNVFPSKINVEEYFDTFPGVNRLFLEKSSSEKNDGQKGGVDHKDVKEIHESREKDDGQKGGVDHKDVKEIYESREKDDGQKGGVYDDSRNNITEVPDLQNKNGRKMQYEDYKKIYASKETNSLTLFVKASIEHLKGNNERALSLIKNDVFYYSVILREYLTVLLGERKISKEFLVLMKKRENDLSTLFYAMLIYLKLNDMNYLTCLDKGLQSYPNQFYVLRIWDLIHNKEYNRAEKVLKSLKMETIALMSLACEFYFLIKKYDDVPALIDKMQRMSASDPRAYLFRAMLKIEKNEDGVKEELTKCFELDKTFMKPYIVLGNYLMKRNDKECVKYFEMARDMSGVKDDVEAAVQALILLQVQDMCVKEYPDLFE